MGFGRWGLQNDMAKGIITMGSDIRIALKREGHGDEGNGHLQF